MFEVGGKKSFLALLGDVARGGGEQQRTAGNGLFGSHWVSKA